MPGQMLYSIPKLICTPVKWLRLPSCLPSKKPVATFFSLVAERLPGLVSKLAALHPSFPALQQPSALDEALPSRANHHWID